MLYQENTKTCKLDLELRKTVPYEYIVERTFQDFYLPHKADWSSRDVLVLPSALVGFDQAAETQRCIGGSMD